MKKGILTSGSEQLRGSLEQEIFTPSNIESLEVADLDRPYAGFMGISGGWSSANNSRLVEVDLLMGIVGPASAAGTFQRWYHNNIVKAASPIWENEVENSFHINMYTGYLKEWRLAPNPFSVYLGIKPQIAFGTRDRYIHPEVIATFGRRNPLSSSVSHNRLGSLKREIFFSLTAGYSYVFYNAFLQGKALKDNAAFLNSAIENVWYYGFDFKHRVDQNEYWVGYRLNTPESLSTEAHKFIILSYARNFGRKPPR